MQSKLVFRRNGQRIELTGRFEDIMKELRRFCPSGKVAEIFSTEDAQ